MIDAIPNPLRIILLGVLGALVGQFINWGIYRWGFEKSSASPWTKPDKDELKRTLADRCPIYGWFLLKRESIVFGKGHWIRPMSIEIFWTIALPGFYQWLATGGMTEPIVIPTPAQADLWFFGLSILTVLLFIATFIDFDQRIIPDWITVPGTLFALLLCAVFPNFRLPVMVNIAVNKWATEPLHFMSPNALPAPPAFHHGSWGLVIALVIFSIWVAALLPLLYLPSKGFLSRIKLNGAKICRSLTRKNKLRVHNYFRQLVLMFLAIWVVGVAAIAGCWFSLPAVNCDALFGAFLGLAMGGAMVWSIRIVAGIAMGQEAMGFGDVTLMAMIGAFLGWQASLITFAIAPFAALIIVIGRAIFTKDNKLAFGPYLALGAVLTFLFWASIWPAVQFQFLFAPLLLGALAISLLIMGPLLILVRMIKVKALGIDDEEELDD